MSQPTDISDLHSEPLAKEARGPSRRGVEVVVALVLIGLAGAVLYDSYGRGAGWSGGPESGFFPARVGWLFLAGSAFLLVQAFREPPAVFVAWGQLAMVARVFVPLAVFCALIQPLGIYVASAVFIFGFMLVIGGSRWITILATSSLTPLIAFWVFEKQFLVPLPKGPVEAFFGY
jgi:putative tricarboxylic transport membrane protein